MNENFDKNSNEILNESSIENANTNTADVSDTESKIREIDAVIAKYSAMLEESKAKEKATESIISTSFRKKMLVMATVMCFAVVTFISSLKSETGRIDLNIGPNVFADKTGFSTTGDNGKFITGNHSGNHSTQHCGISCSIINFILNFYCTQ